MIGFPIVNDADRAWAMAQCPPWAKLAEDDAEVGEIVDDGGWLDGESGVKSKLPVPNWSDFVHEQAERFEKFFADEYYAGRCQLTSDWSALWRKGWWPKADPYKRFPRMGKKEFQPFFRKGSKEFDRAISLATDQEKRLWLQFGIAQFKPHDPRLKSIQGVAKEAAVANRIIGEGEGA
jgi:hypothetical protein